MKLIKKMFLLCFISIIDWQSRMWFLQITVTKQYKKHDKLFYFGFYDHINSYNIFVYDLS